MGNKIRKVSLPINIKMTSVVLLITGVSLALYIYLAIDLFKTDKIAYVFEAVEKQNQQVALGIEKYFDHARLMHNLLPDLVKQSQVSSQFMQANSSILGYLEFNGTKRLRSIRGATNIDLREINAEKYNLHDEFVITSDKTGKRIIIHTLISGDLKSLLILNYEQLKQLIPESTLYQYNLKISDEFIFNPAEFVIGKDLGQYLHQTLVVEDSKAHKSIVAFSPLLERKLIFMTSVDYQKALNASAQLRERSLYFGALVAGFVILIILFFSKIITNPIKKLYTASTELSKKNFSYRVKLGQKDEIGALGDSFNFMASEIEKYMLEMKEKARLENEVKTAQLVQKSFFPTDHIQGMKLSLKAYYKPASECGGDWWGYLSFPESEVVILLDVTGHGTAAALLTAVVQNSLVALKHLGEMNPDYRSNPAQIMNYLNESFCAVNINLNATAFVMVISQNEIRYSNASHNPPFLVKNSPAKSYTKQDFFPLVEKIGARLGEKLQSEYEIVSINYSQGDHVILYTDGILEAENNEGKAFGNRNFIKSLSQNLAFNYSDTVSKTIDDFYQFLAGSEPSDDISLINVEFK